eukprot:89716_1
MSNNKQNMNILLKSLDPMFRVQLEHYASSNNQNKFNQAATEHGFTISQLSLLYDAIQLFTSHSNRKDCINQQQKITNNCILSNQTQIDKYIVRIEENEKINNNNNIIQQTCTQIRIRNDDTDEQTEDEQVASNSHIINGKYACKYCEKRFTTSNKLVIHTRIHRKTKRFKCYECNKSFATAYPLKRHMNQMHTNNGKYACKYCEKRFTVPSQLVIHTRCHTNEKPFK